MLREKWCRIYFHSSSSDDNFDDFEPEVYLQVKTAIAKGELWFEACSLIGEMTTIKISEIVSYKLRTKEGLEHIWTSNKEWEAYRKAITGDWDE